MSNHLSKVYDGDRRIPVSTRRRFNVVTTLLLTSKQRCYSVKTTSYAINWDNIDLKKVSFDSCSLMTL